jgi:hypothetical protein
MRRTCLGLTLAGLLLAAACDAAEGTAPPRALDAGTATDPAEATSVNPTARDADAVVNPAGPDASAGAGAPDASAAEADAAGGMASDAGAAGAQGLDFPDALAWSTGEFELGPGQERYLCFASTLEQDVVVNAFATRGQPFVHHLIFSRSSSAKDKLGFEECDTAFRNGWQPLFITGAGHAKLELPTDAGHKLAKGTKLVIQMHLLNFKQETVKGTVQINMRRSAQANPRPVSTFIFGSADVSLPPRQKSEVKGECKLSQNVKLIAGFPHMHLLGTSLRFEVGSSASDMKPVFNRDPYLFDAQTIELLDVALKSGDLTRVTCGFNNTTDQTVGYGESTKTEMCYFIGFAIDRPAQGACLASVPIGGLIDTLFP